MFARITREVIDVPDVPLLEYIRASTRGVALWEKGLPNHVRVKVLYQLAVTGLRAVDPEVLMPERQHRCQKPHHRRLAVLDSRERMSSVS